MADPLRPIEPAHLETSEREAFQTEREKFRRDNLNRIQAKLQYHSVSYVGLDGKQRVNQSLGLKVIPNVSYARGNKIPVDLASIDSIDTDRPITDTHFNLVPTDSSLLRELACLDKDALALGRSEQITHVPDAMAARPSGPDIPSIDDEDSILAAMEDFIDTKCGPGSLHPHLTKKESA